MSSGPRILQVLADTDASPGNTAALDLHGALVLAASEVRTVALAPGRTGELASVVPAIAPARRSLAALSALRNEARWADAVLFQGVRALPPGVHRLRSLPAVVLRARPDEQVPERLIARLAARGPVTLLTDDTAPPVRVPGRAGARHAVLAADLPAPAAAEALLCALGRGPRPPGAP